MKVFNIVLILNFFLFSCGTEAKHKAVDEEPVNEKISFWDTQRKGTNYFNKTPTKEWFDAANLANIKFVRLTFDKWIGENEYFLIGSADNYKGIVEKDFLKLKIYLDYAYQLNIKIVICPISIPGEKWRQSNNGQHDGRLWQTNDYIDQVIHFWKDLATRLKDHPAIVGFNLVNEPHPEIYFNKHSFWKRDLEQWHESIKDTPADLNNFNTRLVKAIRTVDDKTPIIVESGLYATPWAFDYLQALHDDKIIYSFHMYEPYIFTTKKLNQGQYSYSGNVPIEESAEVFELNKRSLHTFFDPVREWSKKYNIPSNRIWVGEFGCNRHVEGVESYLKDLISIFNNENWHWSFYAFREDVWEAMDYELGTQKVFYKYWDYQDENNLHLHYEEIYGKQSGNSLWELIENEFK